MRSVPILILFVGLMVGCGDTGEGTAEYAESAPVQRTLVQVEEPEPLEIPPRKEVTSDTDWEARTHNKNVEIVEVLNVINPVAAYITAGFDQHGDKFSDVLNEEWRDTQAQLTSALTLYEDCNKRRDAGEFDKQLFLDLEEVWQLLVKTGVAGMRTKSMVASEVTRMTGQ